MCLHVYTKRSITFLVNGVFQINQTELAKLRTSGALSITFRATDSMNASSEISPDIYYCPCEVMSECDDASVSENGVSDPTFGMYSSVKC